MHIFSFEEERDEGSRRVIASVSEKSWRSVHSHPTITHQVINREAGMKQIDLLSTPKNIFLGIFLLLSCLTLVLAQTPTITSIKQDGTNIIIDGTGFGTNPAVIVLKSNIPDITTGINIVVPDTQLKIAMPSNGQDASFSVTVDGVSSNGLVAYLTPVITTCTRPPTNGGSIVYQGYYFRANYQPTALFNGTSIPITSYTSGTANLLASVTVTAPAGTGLVTLVSKTVTGYSSAPYQLWYQAPAVTSADAGANTVVISGSNLGANVAKISLVAPTYPLGTNTSIAPTAVSHTTAIFEVTNVNVLNGPAQVSVDGQMSVPFTLSFYPVINSMNSVGMSGGSNITIKGTSLYPFDSLGNALTASVTIGGNDCPILSSSMDASFTYLVCRAPAGTGTQTAIVTINGLASNNFAYTFGVPEITSIIQSNSDYGITIQGANFGPNKDVVTLTINSNAVLITSFNDTTIVGTVWATSSNGVIQVRVNTISSAPFPINFKPVITAVPVIPLTGGTVTITGRYLSMLRANGALSTMSILFNGKPASASSSTANFVASFLTVIAPSGVGANLPLTVSIDGVVSDPFLFSYDAPTISSVAQGVFPAITIFGTNFGADLSVIKVVANNGQEYVPTAFVPNGGVSFNSPADLKNGVINVRVGNQMAASNSTLILTPVLTSVNTLSLTGGNLTITGAYLNTVDYLNAPLIVSVVLGNTQLTNIQGTGSTLTCEYPTGLGGASLFLTVSIGAQSRILFVSFPAPIITSSVLTQNTTDRTVTVTGKNFGTNFGSIQVLFGVLRSVTDTTIVFVVAETVTNGPFTVKSFSQISNAVTFNATPLITSMSGAKTQGSTTTLLGKYLTSMRTNQTPTVASIQIDGGAPITSQITLQGTSLTFPLPAGTGANHTLALTIDGQIATFVFSYPTPTITSIVQESVANHYTQTISILGTSFGAVSSNVQVLFSKQPNVQCSQIVATDTLITATLPTFVLSDVITVNVSGQISSIYSQPIGPILKSITSADAEGGEIKIGGLYLNNVDAFGTPLPIAVWFPNNVPCTNVVKIADGQDMSYITCLAPPGNGINVQVTVQVVNLFDTINFAYGSPVINSVVVANDNSAVSIAGKNFGASQAGVGIFFDNTQLLTIIYVNSTFLVVPSPTAMRNALVTVKLADGRISNPVPLAIKPLITSVAKPIKTTGDQLTIVGNYLYPTRMDGSSTNVTVVIADLNQQCTNAVANGVSIICTSPQGSGVNHNVIVYIDGAQSPSSVTLSYIAPLITNIAQQGNSDNLIITGTNLGLDLAKITINNQIIATTLTSATSLSAKLTGPSKNGDIKITVDGQVSNTLPLKIKALVSSISSTSPYGGVVELVGKYLWTTRLDSTPTTISIDIGGVECTSPVAGDGNDGTKLNCTLGDASQYESDVELSIDSVYAYSTTAYYSNPPVLTSISSSFYLVSNVVTIVGNEFYPQSYVTIGGSQCSNVVVVDAQHITCLFDSNVGDNATSTLDVTISSDNSDEISFAKVFKYTLLQCLNSCSSHGTCVTSGQCQCDNGYTGADCSITYTQSLVAGDSGSVSGGKFTMFNNSMEFLLSHIQEVRQDNSIVKTIPLTKWDVYNEFGNTTVYNSSATTHNIQLYVTKHATSSIQSFIGDDLVIPSNSIKHFMTIDSFTFESTNSSLRIIYQFKSPSDIEYNCENETTKYQYDTSSSSTTIKSYSIDTPVGTMMASFSNRVEIDENYAMVSSIQAITSVDSSTPSTNGIQYIAIQVPSFGDYVEIDPIFSATSKTAPSTDACIVSSSSITTPSTIILFVVSLILLSIF
ncbi:hypothetical protein DFA_10040 [Cavenderia fasciculata]|uniref:EGF-like domain-containing protein n=1 Tax=Cavenderia fasciculata TaxID=261658 RepID=F4Q941_CACFS|nr:uncharacterized protein DFA_10040 [Cavenderia fasciculata]EGG15210.1 hypothetical protein DFA_10040 [Cavenderia fasciculata]|eukprot:XP_004351930.1 hypothetical protein DFA_10040 [Cavenderia fasciculata]